MCTKSPSMRCIQLEHACLAIAVLNAVLTLLYLLACITVGLQFSSYDGVMNSHNSHSVEMDYFLMFVSVVFGVTMRVEAVIIGMASLVGFISSVMLCYGICKRKQELVKAYLTYGVIIIGLGVVLGMFLLFTADAMMGLRTLVICAVHGSYLILVHMTYLKFLEEDPTSGYTNMNILEFGGKINEKIVDEKESVKC